MGETGVNRDDDVDMVMASEDNGSLGIHRSSRAEKRRRERERERERKKVRERERFSYPLFFTRGWKETTKEPLLWIDTSRGPRN